MEIFQERLLMAMNLRGIRATRLSRESGLSKARISQYVNGRYTPKGEGVLAIARVLEVSPLWLLGVDGAERDLVVADPAPAHTETPVAEPTDAAPTSSELPREAIPCPPNVSPLCLRRYPVLGEIACGCPILAEEDRDGSYVTAAETNADFCLTAKGDSMIGARILDGDLVFIQQTDVVENGEIAAVVVESDATLKRVFYYPEEETLVLVPENAAYDPLVFVGEELDHIHILGRAVAFQARVH